MGRTRKIIITLGLLMIVGLCLYPPYQLTNTAQLVSRQAQIPPKAATHITYIGHYWIWNPPPDGVKEVVSPGLVTMSSVATVDWRCLGVYVGLVGVVILFLMRGALAWPARSRHRHTRSAASRQV